MQVTVRCPGCGTSFRLDGSKVPPEGLQAKCSVCSAVIPVEPLPQDASVAAVSDSRFGAPAPQPEPQRPTGASPSPDPQTPEPAPQSTVADGDPVDAPPEVPHQIVHHGSREELLEMMLDAERERREMAWEMSRELFRLREVVERQQTVVSQLVDAVSKQLPAPLDPGLANVASGGTPPATPTEQSASEEKLLAHQEVLEEELQRLKTALDTEKDVVERLRRGKLDLERRAAGAEATIEALHKRGFLQRLLRRSGD